MLQLHRMIVRLEVRMQAIEHSAGMSAFDQRMEELEDRVEQRVSYALGGFQTLVEDALDAVEDCCLKLKLELEARLRADVRAQFADLDAKLDRDAKLRAFPSIPVFPVPETPGSVRAAVRRLEARDLLPSHREVAPLQPRVDGRERALPHRCR